MLKQLTVDEVKAFANKGLEGYRAGDSFRDAIPALEVGNACAYTTELEVGVVVVVKGKEPESLEVYEYYGDITPVIRELIELTGGRLSCHAYIGMDDYNARCLPTLIGLGFTEVDFEGYNGEGHLLLKYVRNHDVGFTDFTAEALPIMYAMGVHATYAQVRLELLRQLPDIVGRVVMGLKEHNIS